MKFKVLSEIRQAETIATGHGIRDLHILNKRFGPGYWRKMKGIALVEFANGTLTEAELHWYEAHGIGRRWLKVKRVIRR